MLVKGGYGELRQRVVGSEENGNTVFNYIVFCWRENIIWLCAFLALISALLSLFPSLLTIASVTAKYSVCGAPVMRQEDSGKHHRGTNRTIYTAFITCV